MTEELKPCPACGNAKMEISETRTWHCCNRSCWLVGPSNDPDGAKWNDLPRRATGAAEQGDEVVEVARVLDKDKRAFVLDRINTAHWCDITLRYDGKTYSVSGEWLKGVKRELDAAPGDGARLRKLREWAREREQSRRLNAKSLRVVAEVEREVIELGMADELGVMRSEIDRLLAEPEPAPAPAQDGDDDSGCPDCGRSYRFHDAGDCVAAERDKLRAEVEMLRGQIAACGVLAYSNTRESLDRNRKMHPDYECDSVRCVISAVEREIGLRDEVEKLRADAVVTKEKLSCTEVAAECLKAKVNLLRDLLRELLRDPLREANRGQ